MLTAPRDVPVIVHCSTLTFLKVPSRKKVQGAKGRAKRKARRSRGAEEQGSLRGLKRNIEGYFKALLKTILSYFEVFWPFSLLSLLSGPVSQSLLRAL